MSEPVLDPQYWAKRLADAKELHHSIFKCPIERWRLIEEQHREILARTVGNFDTVLDCGCGYGRLLSLMPGKWNGAYLGIDLSPELIELAKSQFDPGRGAKHRPFYVADLRDLSWWQGVKFDWAVLISIRPMIKRNCGDGVWAEMEREIRKVAKKLLYLEYDVNDEGSVE